MSWNCFKSERESKQWKIIIPYSENASAGKVFSSYIISIPKMKYILGWALGWVCKYVSYRDIPWLPEHAMDISLLRSRTSDKNGIVIVMDTCAYATLNIASSH